MKNTSRFQNVVIATIVGWLVLFVFLPNLMIIGTSFLTRDDTNFVKLVFTLDNYARLLDPLYYDVLLHSLNMALLATLACGARLSLCTVSGEIARESAPAAAVSADRALLDQFTDSYLWTEDLSQHQRLSQRVSTVVRRYRYAAAHHVHPSAVIIGFGLYSAAVYGNAALLQHREARPPAAGSGERSGCQQATNLYPHHHSADHAGHYCWLPVGDAPGDGAVLCF